MAAAELHDATSDHAVVQSAVVETTAVMSGRGADVLCAEAVGLEIGGEIGGSEMVIEEAESACDLVRGHKLGHHHIPVDVEVAGGSLRISHGPFVFTMQPPVGC